jgi:hypothetical protein
VDQDRLPNHGEHSQRTLKGHPDRATAMRPEQPRDSRLCSAE